MAASVLTPINWLLHPSPRVGDSSLQTANHLGYPYNKTEYYYQKGSTGAGVASANAVNKRRNILQLGVGQKGQPCATLLRVHKWAL